MNLSELKNSRKTVGTKQAIKAVQKGDAQKVFVASDAEPRVVMPLIELCTEKNVPIEKVDSMEELGKACGINVGTASVAVIK